MMDKPFVGVIVDVQNDFMNSPDREIHPGRLYVQNKEKGVGAEDVRDQIIEAANWMDRHALYRLFTADWHDHDDDEIDADTPDYVNTFPPHCMGKVNDPNLISGAWIIKEIVGHPDFLFHDTGVTGNLEAGRETMILKNKFDMFSGCEFTDDAINILEKLNGPEVDYVVMGVALDVCVKFAVEGLLERGKSVVVLKDATCGLGIIDDEILFEKWESMGARVTTLDEEKARRSSI